MVSVCPALKNLYAENGAYYKMLSSVDSKACPQSLPVYT